jgi:hypothetical protein
VVGRQGEGGYKHRRGALKLCCVGGQVMHSGVGWLGYKGTEVLKMPFGLCVWDGPGGWHAVLHGAHCAAWCSDRGAFPLPRGPPIGLGAGWEERAGGSLPASETDGEIGSPTSGAAPLLCAGQGRPVHPPHRRGCDPELPGQGQPHPRVQGCLRGRHPRRLDGELGFRGKPARV